MTTRVLGVLGGMSWESTAVYYRLLNQRIAAARGGLHSASLLLASVDFAPVAARQASGDWDGAAAPLAETGRRLREAGAGALLLATNTMHKVADAIEAGAGLPLLHVADATGAALVAAGHRRVGLLGTRYTMEDAAIVAARLRLRHRLEVIVPGAEDRAMIHRVIYEELCRGVVDAGSRGAYLRAIERLAAEGAQAVVFGCTEIGLLVDPADAPLPAFDSAVLHARAGADWLLAGPAADEETR